MTEHDLMTTDEVAALFRVDPKTVNRWEQAGRFPEGVIIRTPGGSRRYKTAGVMALLGQENEK